ncbi:putative ribonuclease H-like domain-containing protein [Tanacetum coccineum]|uniref:Ribonuclease H-like domain-containing protein n=1 Tax=Tanacetum coccineum TaxID=301880 RepID=A0ABQ5I2Q2_9ASTR
MTTLKFANTHNLVVFLEKPTESDGFEQIVDFLNDHTIKYALTVYHTTYISCIEQFWTTAKVKTVIGEVHLQALVNGKKIIINESTIRRDLQLEDAEGVDCLPNATIFEQLTLMSAKTTAWNKFSSTMASAIICLATNQKFNFLKFIFESMMKNLENMSGKFLMYPRFVQVFLEKQLEGMSNHKRIYVAPSHTKKMFRNMRRVGKGFSGRETPLFPTMMVHAQEVMVEGSANPTDPYHTPTIIQPSKSKPQKKQKPRKPKRKDTEVPQSSGSTEHVADEAVYKELDDSLVRAATTASSLEVEHDNGSGPRYQETMGDTIAQTRFENVSKTSNDSLLAGVNTPQKNTKTAQAQEITSLKLRVKKLEKKGGSRTHKLKRLYKVGRSARIISSDESSLGNQEDASKQGRKIDDIDKNAEITLVDETHERYGDDLMFYTSDLAGEEVFVAEQGVPDSKKDDIVSIVGVATTVSAAATTVPITPEEITLAQTLKELKTAKPKAKRIVFKEPVKSTTKTIVSSQQPSQVKVQDKGKGEMVEPEKPVKKKELIRLDEEIASKLQAEFDEEDNVPAMIDADYKMAQQMKAEEQEKLSIEEKSKLFVQLLEARKKHFAAMRAQEKRNKPPTKAQKRKTMSTYLKNMARYKHNQLKNKSFDDIQNEVRTEAEIAQESSSKRACTELEQESIKKQKVDKDKETTELQRLIEVVPNKKEVAIDAIPLATKPPSIVDYKIYKEGKKTYYQITRTDESSKMYLGNLKIMFDPHVEDQVWKNQSDYRVLDWKLYVSWGVHSLRKQNVHIHMLVEKRYPLTAPTIIDMLNRKLQADHWNEMYNAANDDDPMYWPACCRIMMRGNDGRASRTRGCSGDQGDGRNDSLGGQVGGQGSEVNDDVNGVPDFFIINAQQLQNLLPTIVAQVGDQGRGQGSGRNQNDDAVIDNIRGVVEKIRSVQDMSGCRDNQKVKYTTGSFVGKALTWWNSQIHTRGREAVVGFMSWLGMVTTTEPKTIQKAVQLAGTLTDEALRNGSIKKNPEKRGNEGEPSKDRNVRDDNKRTRTGNAFATTTNHVGRENTGTLPKCTTCNTHHLPEAPRHTCFNYNRPGHFARDYRVAPRNMNVNPVNARNPTARACYECGGTDHIKSACPSLIRAQGSGVNRTNLALANNGG